MGKEEALVALFIIAGITVFMDRVISCTKQVNTENHQEAMLRIEKQGNK